MDKKQVIDRMAELMIPIDQAIMMCDDNKEALMLASAMLSTSKTIYTTILGEKGAASVMKSAISDISKYN